jgi:hypothetical protein
LVQAQDIRLPACALHQIVMVASKRKSETKGNQDVDAVITMQHFTIEDVIAAIESLYADELKPVSKLLRKRIYDRINAASGNAGTFDVDMKSLRTMCNECAKLNVRNEDRGEWSTEVIGHRRSFVDISSPHDPYPSSLWANLTMFLKSPEGENLCLSGGRCATAEALRDYNLPCLARLSLGRLCHIVELALNQKKLLGYRNSCIVPYKLSERAHKEQNALQQRPCAKSEVEVATLETARECLRILLHEVPNGTLPLPNVKRLFRSRFHLQLSETTFGYTKVSDLLQDSRFNDLCTVEFDAGYVIKRKVQVISILDGLGAEAAREKVSEDEPCRVQFCQEEPLQMDEAEVLLGGAPVWLAPSPAPDAPRWSLSLNTLSKENYAGIVRNTFIHADLPPTTPLLRAPRRVHTVPKDMSFEGPAYQAADTRADDSTTDSRGSSRCSSPEVSNNTDDWLLQSLDSLMTFTGQVAPFDESTCRSPRLRFSSGEALSLESAGSTHDSSRSRVPWSLESFTSVTPLAHNVSSLPYVIRTPMVPEDTELPTIVDLACRKHEQKSRGRATSRVHFADFEKSEVTNECDVKEGIHMHATVQLEETSRSIWPALTPGALSKKGFIVRDGFLDVPLVLPTPFKESASRRSHSVPKSMWSDTCPEKASNGPGESELSSKCIAAPLLEMPSHVCLLATPSQYAFPPTPWQC